VAQRGELAEQAAAIMANLGLLEENNRQYRRARRWYSYHLSAAYQLDQQSWQPTTHLALSRVCQELRQDELGFQHAEIAVTLLQQSKSASFYCVALHYLYDYYRSRGEHLRAGQVYEELNNARATLYQQRQHQTAKDDQFMSTADDEMQSDG
jgi:hypothetical protein